MGPTVRDQKTTRRGGRSRWVSAKVIKNMIKIMFLSGRRIIFAFGTHHGLEHFARTMKKHGFGGVFQVLKKGQKCSKRDEIPVDHAVGPGTIYPAEGSNWVGNGHPGGYPSWGHTLVKQGCKKRAKT